MENPMENYLIFKSICYNESNDTSLFSLKEEEI